MSLHVLHEIKLADRVIEIYAQQVSSTICKLYKKFVTTKWLSDKSAASTISYVKLKQLESWDLQLRLCFVLGRVMGNNEWIILQKHYWIVSKIKSVIPSPTLQIISSKIFFEKFRHWDRNVLWTLDFNHDPDCHKRSYQYYMVLWPHHILQQNFI